MDWVKKFYSTTGHWWGPAGQVITNVERKRVGTIKRLGGKPGMTILELGASYGETAAACAEEGFNIVGVELSDRADYSEVFANKKYKGEYKILKEDFYKVKFDKKFDIVTYWNGFGIGTDDDQRKLFRRISGEWLKDDGFALIDVFNPFCWASWDGDDYNAKPRPEKGYHYEVSQHIVFDPINNRFIDTWWLTNKPEEKFTQDIRCYSVPDLLLLLDHTGLKFDYAEVKGTPLEKVDHKALMKKVHEYLVKLYKSS